MQMLVKILMLILMLVKILRLMLMLVKILMLMLVKITWRRGGPSISAGSGHFQ